jgi:hypothetical protein
MPGLPCVRFLFPKYGPMLTHLLAQAAGDTLVCDNDVFEEGGTCQGGTSAFDVIAKALRVDPFQHKSAGVPPLFAQRAKHHILRNALDEGDVRFGSFSGSNEFDAALYLIHSKGA